MSREVEFRVWDKVLKVMEKALVVYFNNKTVYFIHKGSSQERDFEDVELIQFTGLHDKNGKKIFEGDIVEGNYNVVAVIVWSQEFGRWSMRWSGESITPISWHVKNATVIGNIHENPELLK